MTLTGFNKVLLVFSVLVGARVSASGVCLLCPPGYDCSNGSPVAQTGSAALATIGDISWGKISGRPEAFATVGQLMKVINGYNKPNIVWECSMCDINNCGELGPQGSGPFCWCRMQNTELTGHTSFSSWTNPTSYAQATMCGNSCETYCKSENSWRADSKWDWEK